MRMMGEEMGRVGAGPPAGPVRRPGRRCETIPSKSSEALGREEGQERAELDAAQRRQARGRHDRVQRPLEPGPHRLSSRASSRRRTQTTAWTLSTSSRPPRSAFPSRSSARPPARSSRWTATPRPTPGSGLYSIMNEKFPTQAHSVSTRLLRGLGTQLTRRRRRQERHADGRCPTCRRQRRAGHETGGGTGGGTCEDAL